MSDETIINGTAGRSVIRVLSASAQRAALTACAQAFVTQPAGKASGDNVHFNWATSGAVTERIEAGEQFDIIAASQLALEMLEAKALVRRPIYNAGISRIALGMRKGETPPDISTIELFKQALLSAKSFSRGDPAGGGTAGNFLADMLACIGVSEETQAKSNLQVGGFNVMREVAEGRADFGLTQSTEIVAVDGVEISAWLPDALQMDTIYALSAGPDLLDAGAQAFLEFVTGDAGQAIYAAAGFAKA